MATNPIQSSAMQQHMGPSCLSERRCTVVGAPVKLSQANWTPLVIKKHLERKKEDQKRGLGCTCLQAAGR
jgi:hypothetical protein